MTRNDNYNFLEHARLLAPDNQNIYRDIIRVQAELGLTETISRTLRLLATVLAETNEEPAPDTIALARAVEQRQHHRMATG